MTMMQHRRVRYIGLDVHKATIAVAIAEEEGSPSSYGTIANDPDAVRKLMRQLGGKGVDLQVAYEARPTGYALHRQLTKLGITCMVVAPDRKSTRLNSSHPSISYAVFCLKKN